MWLSVSLWDIALWVHIRGVFVLDILLTTSAEAAEMRKKGDYPSPAEYMPDSLPKEKDVLGYLLHE